ncbi:unnamed protein product [Cochlearia groenlandica]
MVVPSRAVQCVSTSTSSIRFTEYTTLTVAKLTTQIIDEDLFRLRNYEELANIVDENSDLFDVMGRIRLVTFDASQPSYEKVHLHLQMEELSHRMQQTRVLGNSSAVTKVETVTIVELHEFFVANTKQASRRTESGSSCHVQGTKKKEVIGEVFLCTFPEYKNEGTLGGPKFRFEAFVGDETSTATVVIVDSVGQKIAEQTAATLVEVIVEDDGVESLAFTPQCFKDLIGHTKKIEIKVIPDTQDDSRHDNCDKYIPNGGITTTMEF